MLLSMSKQSFAGDVFTHITLNEACIFVSPSSEGIPQLPSFHMSEDFRLSPPAINGFPVRFFHLGFSVGTGGTLNKSERRGLARVSLRLARKGTPEKQLYPTDVSPISPSTQSQGGVR